MKITEIFKTRKQTFSFEFFPPKTESGYNNLLKTIKELKAYRPDFVSVTYGAMGTTREKTLSITKEIQSELGLTAMSHLTCVGTTAKQIEEILDELKKSGIQNIMALRGDPPQGEKNFVHTEGGFRYATDLIKHITEYGDFCIGAAGYPEGHIEAKDIDTDLDFLKMKMDCGADFIVTQLFLSNSDYFRFRERAERKGISLRLIPGIMPITNFQQIYKFADMCGCKIPKVLENRLYPVRENKEEVIKIGTEYATDQCRDLIQNDCPGFHFYTLNKSASTKLIYSTLAKDGLIPSA